MAPINSNEMILEYVHLIEGREGGLLYLMGRLNTAWESYFSQNDVLSNLIAQREDLGSLG